jgi:hypothetical protein
MQSLYFNFLGGFGGNQRNGFGGNSSSAGAGSKLRPVDWNRVQLEPLKKDIYSESPLVADRPQFEVDAWLSSNQVTLSGQHIPRAVFEFGEASYPKSIVDLLYQNYERPTIIQSISWPVALSGRDMISIAKTGSGKTLGVSSSLSTLYRMFLNTITFSSCCLQSCTL